MIGNAIVWKFPGQDFICREDSSNQKDILCFFPAGIEGINYVEQLIPTLCAHGEKQKYEKELLPSLEDQAKWIEEYKVYGLPMVEWKRDIAESDRTMMPRSREHLITKIDNGIADNEEEQKRYDAKISLRATKPGKT